MHTSTFSVFLIVLFLVSFDNLARCQIESSSDTINFTQLSGRAICLDIKSANIQFDSLSVNNIKGNQKIEGYLVDPDPFFHPFDLTQISIVGGIQSPFVGFGIEYQRVRFFLPYIAGVSIRSDFNDDVILSTTFELTDSPNGSSKISNFYTNYRYSNLPNSNLNNYSCIQLGPVFRSQWKFGFLLGCDNYTGSPKIGAGLIMDRFIYYLLKNDVGFRVPIVINAKALYMNKRINYNIEFSYLSNFKYQIGIGVERLYDYSALNIVFKYLIFR